MSSNVCGGVKEGQVRLMYALACPQFTKGFERVRLSKYFSFCFFGRKIGKVEYLTS